MNSYELERLRDHVLMACTGMTDEDPRVSDVSLSEYEDLVDEFAAAFESQVAPQQIEAARREPEYFMRLIDLASEYLKVKLKTS